MLPKPAYTAKIWGQPFAGGVGGAVHPLTRNTPPSSSMDGGVAAARHMVAATRSRTGLRKGNRLQCQRAPWLPGIKRRPGSGLPNQDNRMARVESRQLLHVLEVELIVRNPGRPIDFGGRIDCCGRCDTVGPQFHQT